MKLLFAGFLISALGTYFFMPEKLPANFAAAEADKVEGLYIFIHAQPVQPFKVLATFKVKQTFTGEPKEQMKTALAAVHKNYTDANAIIFIDENMQSAQAVKIE